MEKGRLCHILATFRRTEFPILTIRKTLLLAFLFVSLLPAMLLTYLAFHVAGDAMREDIRRSLQIEAESVSQDVDKMLFERLQNAQTWSRLEVMQDIQIRDVDKRLSNFLAELKSGYRNVYQQLLCTDTEGRIVASSTPDNIGLTRLPGDENVFPGTTNAAIRLETLQLDNRGDNLPIKAPISSIFNDARIGELILVFDWGQIYRMLDHAAQERRHLALLDADGRVIAASSELRKRGALLQKIPAGWTFPERHGVRTLAGEPWFHGEVTVGFEHSPGFQQFPGFGWTTLVIESSRQAYIPVRQMAWVFALLLAVTSLLAVGFSMLIAGRIARPIAALTDFTRRFKRDRQLPPAPQAAGGEVGELTETFIQTVRDLDQSRADLIRASKLAVLGEVAAVMAHEIRTPVGILRSSAQMLARDPGLNDEARELTGFIESEADRLNRLVTTLLDSARQRTPHCQPTDLHDVIRHVAALLEAQAGKNNISITLDLACTPSIVPLDAEQMTQVLLNLVLNALQILPPEGRITITTRRDDAHAIIEVADNGPGIPDEAIQQVFDPFFTKREGGVGLGLAVVQQIVHGHEGVIRAGRSAMGGALFTITLPMRTPA